MIAYVGVITDFSLNCMEAREEFREVENHRSNYANGEEDYMAGYKSK